MLTPATTPAVAIPPDSTVPAAARAAAATDTARAAAATDTARPAAATDTARPANAAQADDHARPEAAASRADALQATDRATHDTSANDVSFPQPAVAAPPAHPAAAQADRAVAEVDRATAAARRVAGRMLDPSQPIRAADVVNAEGGLSAASRAAEGALQAIADALAQPGLTDAARDALRAKQHELYGCAQQLLGATDDLKSAWAMRKR